MKMQAELWEKLPDGAVRCDLCFRHCRIGLGEKGFCAVRVNEDGRLLTLVGDSVVSISLDPVEKKPLYHFLPSTPTLSIGTLGCNFACLFCQNYSISRRPADTGRYDGMQEINPQELVSYAVEHSVPSISFTYNEPTVFYELLCRTADLALPAGIRTVMVTNGCMSRACLNELGPRVTAANVDLKAFREDTYAKICSGSLSAVKRNLVLMKEKGWWVEDGRPAPDSARVIAHENGVAYDLDLENSQKTGFFLDQKYNRRAVRELAHGRRVLDCFCHVGPFGLNAAAGGAEFVREVDVSQTAIDLARENARLNSLEATMDFTCANVLEYLPALVSDKKRLREEGGPFDLIVLDPPAFTKSRGTVDHAAHGYREINEWAMRLLPRGGYLATCSCSHFMTRDLLARAIAEAAHNANVQLRQIEERQQAPDHPILWGVPETHYLDFFVFQVV